MLTFRKVAGLPAIIASRVPGPSPLKQTTRYPSRGVPAAVRHMPVSQSARSRASLSASETLARSAVKQISRGRSSGMVQTTTPPAFRIANQQATIIGLFGPRSSTRLPGTRPRSSTRTFAMRFAVSSSSR